MTIRLSMVLLCATTLLLGGVAQADDAKCIIALNKDARMVSKVQNKEIRKCVKAADKAGATTAEACSTADGKGKIAKAEQKTVDDDVGGAKGKCGGGAPGFLYSGAAHTNTVSKLAGLELAHDIFGDNIDASVVTDGNALKRGCRDGVYGSAIKVFDTKVQAFLKCKTDRLNAGATSNAEIEAACYVAGGPGLEDPNLKVQKGQGKLTDAAKKKCIDTVQNTDALFPGDCVGQAGNPLFAACVDRLVECRVCQMMNDVDGLSVNCDLFDDGLSNGSCSMGTVFTPTPTILTPTPTITLTPTVTPTSLPVKRVFVSTQMFDGNLGGLTGGDAICQAAAAAVGLGSSTWKAWLSTPTENARDRISDGEYRLLDGTFVAYSLADLTDGSVSHTIILDEHGNSNGDQVWTGTRADGTVNTNHCSAWTANTSSDYATIGYAYQTDSRWTAAFPNAWCSIVRSLYCFEQ